MKEGLYVTLGYPVIFEVVHSNNVDGYIVVYQKRESELIRILRGSLKAQLKEVNNEE